MKRILGWNEFKLFEKSPLLEEDGFGRDFFVKKKEGKVSKYFFKLEGEEKTLGFVVSIGKLSRRLTIDEAENRYAVLSVQPIKESVLDDYLVKDSDFKSREDDELPLDKSEFMRFYKIVSECIKDYLQNNPKVSNIYDEMGLNIEIDMAEYRNSSRALMDDWSYNKWSIQEGSIERTLVYTRRDHD
jgi:hypothetical protein